MMKISLSPAYRRVAGVGVGCVLGGIGIGIAGAPRAVAAPDCSPRGAQATVSSVTGAARQYSDLRGILAPIDDTERQCHVTALPPDLESAYHQFMAGSTVWAAAQTHRLVR